MRWAVLRKVARLMTTISAKKERFLRGSKYMIVRAMILPLQNAMLRMGEHPGKLFCAAPQELVFFCTAHEDHAVHHQGGDGDARPLLQGCGVAEHGVSHDGDVVGEGVCYFLFSRPHG